MFAVTLTVRPRHKGNWPWRYPKQGAVRSGQVHTDRVINITASSCISRALPVSYVTALLTLILTRPARPLIRRLPQPPLVGFDAHAAVGSQTSKPQRQSGISGGGLMAEELRGGPTSGSGSKFNQHLGICVSTSSRCDCC